MYFEYDILAPLLPHLVSIERGLHKARHLLEHVFLTCVAPEHVIKRTRDSPAPPHTPSNNKQDMSRLISYSSVSNKQKDRL